MVRENVVSAAVLDAAIEVHRTLGPGLLESVYEAALAFELRRRGFVVERQVAIPVSYKGVRLGEGFRLDLLVDGCVIVELKAQDGVLDVHRRQVMTYLVLSGRRLGLLINFGRLRLVAGFERIVNRLPDEGDSGVVARGDGAPGRG